MIGNQLSVLIVDGSDDNREVLQAVLQRRGVHTMAANRAETGLAMARCHPPDLIVLDLELDAADPEGISADFLEQAKARRAPLVMLGSTRRDGIGPDQGEFVAKPYHYGPLIRRIEELLETPPQALARDD